MTGLRTRSLSASSRVRSVGNRVLRLTSCNAILLTPYRTLICRTLPTLEGGGRRTPKRLPRGLVVGALRFREHDLLDQHHYRTLSFRRTPALFRLAQSAAGARSAPVRPLSSPGYGKGSIFPGGWRFCALSQAASSSSWCSARPT